MYNGYTESEICMLYREAKDKRFQLTILTQLTGLRTFEVERILEEGGYFNLKEETRQAILDYYEQGMNDSEISRAVGMPQSPVSKFLRSEGLPSHGKWKSKKEEDKEVEIKTVQQKVKQTETLESLQEETKKNFEELKNILPKSVPAPEDIPIDYDVIETLTPQQYYELANKTLDLLKTIWG